MSSGCGAPEGAVAGAGAGAAASAATGSAGCLRRGRRLLVDVLVVGLGVGVGREQHRGVTLGVQHFGGVVRVLRQLERIRGQPGNGRRGLHADLDESLHAEAACRLLDEQQILRLDPAHRAGELPGQQLDDDLAAQLSRALVAPSVVVGEDFVERLGGHQIADLLDEVAVQRERPRHQVRNVPARRPSPGLASRGKTRSSARRKSATPTRSTLEWNGTSMPGTRDEGPLATGDLAASLDLFLQHLQPANRARDRVLRTAKVEVHDLQKFARALRYLGDEVIDVGSRRDRSATAGLRPAGSWTGPTHRAARCHASSSRGGTPPPAGPRVRRHR